MRSASKWPAGVLGAAQPARVTTARPDLPAAMAMFDNAAARCPALPAAMAMLGRVATLAGIGIGIAMLASADAGAQTIGAERLSEERIDVAEVLRPAQAGKTYDAVTIIAAPVAQLCAIVQDYGAYPSFMPNTADTRIVSSDDGHTVIDMTLSLPLGKTKRYRLQLEAKHSGDNCQLSWQLLPRADLAVADTIADTSGYWMLTPLPANHNKSVVEYFVYADPGPVPFGFGWIVDILSKKSLPNTLEALRHRAQTQ